MPLPYETRMKRLLRKLEENAIEAALVTTPSSIAYYTGFKSDPMERFLALWIGADGKATLFVPELDALKAEGAQGIDRLAAIPDGKPPLELLKGASKIAPECCGIEKDAVSWQLAERLIALWPETEFVDIGESVREMRGRKTREEADCARAAARIADQALEAAIRAFKRGMRERELAEEIDRQVRLAGGEGNAFLTTVLGGKRTAYPHGETGLHPIGEGDFLLVDMGVASQGYLSDMTRTFLVGEGTEEQARIYETVREASRRAIDAVRAGEPLAGIDEAARSWIRQSGYGGYFPHRVGHGLGMEVHEPPSIHGWNEELIVPGMLFTIEPGIYVPGIGGVRIEDDVYVNESGLAELLTGFPKRLIRL
ncbi:M24 family metallopeptidase [Cohnella sp. GCM10027633]|uniref:M24 family metallopeptidase n=1 Tax=unclassified Cohnella TaxID=2636738 RepID=UPI003638CD6A